MYTSSHTQYTFTAYFNNYMNRNVHQKKNFSLQAASTKKDDTPINEPVLKLFRTPLNLSITFTSQAK